MPPNNSRSFVDDDDDDDGDNTSKDESGDDSDPLDNSNSNSNSSSSDTENNWKKNHHNNHGLDEQTTFDESEASETSGGAYEDDSEPNSGTDEDLDSSRQRRFPSKTAAATIGIAAAAYALEKRRQKQLTQVPMVLGQIPEASTMKSIFERLTKNENENESSGAGIGIGTGILNRPITPSMVWGTHGGLASAAAYGSGGPSSAVPTVVRFSETLVSSHDGAQLVLQWEIPNHSASTGKELGLGRQLAILQGTISHPTVLILHGINNSSDYGYIQSLQRSMTNQGWNAVALNFRGCAAQQSMTTPRSYTASYTGDLRSVVRQLTSRMQHHNHHHNTTVVPLFLVGNSLGANLITKYLGEEGLAGTLPSNVWGGISLGNPFSFRANRMRFPYSKLIGVARKAHYFGQRQAMALTNRPTRVHTHLGKLSLASLDRALAPTMVRTAAHPPFETKIGYGQATNDNSNGGNVSTERVNEHSSSSSSSSISAAAAEDYWADSSCYKQGRHVSVPLLHVIARDDNLCYKNAKQYLGYSLSNPNVLFVQTRTGGHLGWWHQPSSATARTSHSKFKSSSSSWWGLNSWADEMTVDFIQAVIDTKAKETPNPPTTPATTPIDDAHQLFAANRIRNTHKDALVEGRISSVARALPLHRSEDSMIATQDVTAAPSPPPRPQSKSSMRYFQFQQILLLQQQQQQHYKSEERQQWQLERNRLLEKHESIELAALLRSRL